MSLTGRLLLGLLVVDAVLLAVLELFYLPLRLAAEDGGWMVPVSIGLAAVTTPLLVAAAGQLSPRLGVAVAPLAAWAVTILAFGIGGPGGDVVLPEDLRSIALFGAGMLPCGVLLGRRTALTFAAAAGPAVTVPAGRIPDGVVPPAAQAASEPVSDRLPERVPEVVSDPQVPVPPARGEEGTPG